MLLVEDVLLLTLLALISDTLSDGGVGLGQGLGGGESGPQRCEVVEDMKRRTCAGGPLVIDGLHSLTPAMLGLCCVVARRT